MKTNRIRFLNTYIDSLTAAQAKSCADRLIRQGGQHYIVTPNSDIVVKMQDDKELKDICERADLILTDGQILVKLSRLMKRHIKERVCMTDFVWDICDLAAEKGYSIFMFGGKPDVLTKAEKRIKKKYPGLKIAGSFSPELGFEKDSRQLEAANRRIRGSKADILLVFLGCPKQEKYIYANKDIYKVPLSIPMGGCVDFIAGAVKRAPKWMQDVGLEWFYRFAQEPKRLFKRYFIDDMRIFWLAWKYRKV